MKELLDDLRQDMKELIRQTAVHNELLRTHEARSLALQEAQELLKAEIDPIKSHVSLVTTLSKWLGAISIGTCIQYIARHWL